MHIHGNFYLKSCLAKSKDTCIGSNIRSPSEESHLALPREKSYLLVFPTTSVPVGSVNTFFYCKDQHFGPYIQLVYVSIGHDLVLLESLLFAFLVCLVICSKMVANYQFLLVL